MVRIPLIGGKGGDRRVLGSTTVDDKHEKAVLSKGEWVLHKHRTGKFYAKLSRQGLKIDCHLPLATFIWELENGPVPLGMVVDHVDPDDTLNNKLENLRLATDAQNRQNRKCRSDSTSGYMGVTWYERYQKWLVQVSDGIANVNFGYWSDLELAARFRDVIVIQLWGDRAQTNFPRLDYPLEL